MDDGDDLILKEKKKQSQVWWIMQQLKVVVKPVMGHFEMVFETTPQMQLMTFCFVNFYPVSTKMKTARFFIKVRVSKVFQLQFFKNLFEPLKFLKTIKNVILIVFQFFCNSIF